MSCCFLGQTCKAYRAEMDAHLKEGWWVELKNADPSPWHRWGSTAMMEYMPAPVYLAMTERLMTEYVDALWTHHMTAELAKHFGKGQNASRWPGFHLVERRLESLPTPAAIALGSLLREWYTHAWLSNDGLIRIGTDRSS